MSLDARARRAARAARTQVDRLPPPPAIGVLVARRRRRAAAASALALALIVSVGGVAWRALVPTGGRQPAAIQPVPIRSPGPFSPGPSPQVQAAIGVGKTPTAVLVAEGSVWVANSGDGTVSRIDAVTNRVIATIDVGRDPSQLTADSSAIWVATAEGLQRINPAENRVIQTLAPPVGFGYVRAVDGHLWVSLSDGTVQKLDPADGRVLASVSVASTSVSILASDGVTLWAANGGMLVAISPQRATVTERFNEELGRQRGNQGAQFTGLALTGGVAWGSRSDGRVLRFEVDPSSRSTFIADVAPLEGPALIGAGPAGVFVASPSTLTLTRLDFSTGQVIASINLPGLCQVAVGADAVWATAETQGILYRVHF
jgi:YVTN family beta-propeller protein